MARLKLSVGENVGIYQGSYHDIIGTTGGHEQIHLSGGDVSLDPSFNAGGDDLYLTGPASSYQVSHAGATVTLTNAAAVPAGVTTTVTIPAGPFGLTVHFDDVARSLVIVGGAHIMLGAQEVGTSLAPVADATAQQVIAYDADTTIGDLSQPGLPASGQTGATLVSFSALKAVDTVVLGSGRDQSDDDGHQYVINLDNTHTGPATGPSMIIDASALKDDNDGSGPQASETVTVDARHVTAYHLVLLGGSGPDTIHGTDAGDVIQGGGGADYIYMGAGADKIDLGRGSGGAVYDDGNLHGNDIILGASFNETLILGDPLGFGDATRLVYTDADFAGVAGIDTLGIGVAGLSLTLGANAEQGGVTRTVELNDSGNTIIDASATTRGIFFAGGEGDSRVIGGSGADYFEGEGGRDILQGNGGADHFIYQTIADSHGAQMDQILDFTSGVDVIEVTQFGYLQQQYSGRTIAFLGNVSGLAAAQAALHAGDGRVEAVFDSQTHVVWFDFDDNAVLDGNDLAIILTGVSTLVAADVLASNHIA